MIKGSVKWNGKTPLLKYINGVVGKVTNMESLVAPIVVAMYKDNRRKGLAGIGANSKPYAKLAPATLRDHRRGPGPPLAPAWSAFRPTAETEARVIENYVVTANRVAAGQYRIVGTYVDIPWLKYHIQGTKYMPVRDPRGVTLEGRTEITRIVGDFAWEVMMGEFKGESIGDWLFRSI